MTGNVYAFEDALDAVDIVGNDFARTYREHLPLIMLANSKQVFDVIDRALHTTEKRRMIGVAAPREAYKRGEIANVGLLKSEHNVADGRTNSGLCMASDAALQTDMDINPVQQWIIRSPMTTERPD